MNLNIYKKYGLLSALVLLFISSAAWAQEAEVEIKKSSSRRIHCMGQSWQADVYSTSEQDLVMIRGDHKVLLEVARAMGQTLRWSAADTTLYGVEKSFLRVGQKELSVHGENKTLAAVPQVLDGAVHIPSSALEGLLNCKVTVKPGNKGAIYIEPVLNSITFQDGERDSTDVLVRTSMPVRKKVFKLSNPDRTVIDLVGVALPKSFAQVSHKDLGEVRVGQFQLAPSITRIVLPSYGGVKVEVKRTLDLFEHKLAVRWPAGKPPIILADQQVQRVPTIKIKPTEMPDRAPGAITVTPAEEKTGGENPDERPNVTVSPPAASQQSRPTLDEVAWENGKLKLTFSQPVSYQWARVRAGQDRFMIDFPGVIFPQKRQQLASSVPGLQQVRVVQNMPEPQPIVRLVCDLQSPIAVDTANNKDRILYLEFPGRQVSAAEYPKGMGHTSKTVAAANGNGSGRTVCIDAGHGGSDPGALNHSVGINEKTVTFDISVKLAKLLKDQGWNVIMTRSSDRDVSWAGSSAKQELGARADVANKFGADLFISVHANASVNTAAAGTSIHWYKSSDYQLAKLIEGGVMSATGRTNRGLVKNRFFVLAHTEMPAVLIETAFLTNPTEGKLLADPAYRTRIAQGIAAGLQVYASRMFTNSAAQK